MSWIDSHAHIYLDDFDTDRGHMMARCAEQNVNLICMPNIDHTSIDSMLEVEAKYPATCKAMIGLHPCSVKKDFQRELYLVEDWLSKRKFVAVGEIGTDLYWDKTFWDQQQEAFEIQINWAKQYDIPVVIHCRASLDETIRLVSKHANENLRGIFHCFTGTPEQAKAITDLGFYLGIGGVATFKNGGLDKVLPELELKNLVLETDSPYLAPVPHRGKRNEPAYLPLIGTRVATLMQVESDQVMTVTTSNAMQLFKLN
ncbi:MAG: TatD family hydrolase [Cyclobacteriaceae bacterium]